MVAQELYANDAATTVASGGTDAPAGGTQETWTVTSSSSFPAASSTATPPSAFHVADPAAPSELILVTNVSGTTWTVTRGAESSAPVAHSAGFTIVQVIPAGAMSRLATYYSGGTYYLDNYTGTDDQKMTSALSDVFTAGGGIIQLSPRSHTFANQWTTTYTGGVVTAVTIKGAGAALDFGEAAAPSGATSVTFTYSGGGAGCMDFQHIGSIEITGLLVQSANVGVPLFFCTNTSPNLHGNVWSGGATGTACNTDAIVLGGTGNSSGGGDNVKYGGYQGLVYGNFFGGIRHCVLFQGGANAIQVYSNTVSNSCGSSLNFGAPFAFNGNSTHGCTGVSIYGNLIEGTFYQAGISGHYANSCQLGPNSMWDASGFVEVVLDSTCSSNQIEDVVAAAGTNPVLYDNAGTSSIRSAGRNTIFRNGVSVQGTLINRFGNEGPTAEGFFGERVWLAPAGGSAALVPHAYISTSAGTTVSDGVTISGSNIVISLTAAFALSDVGVQITDSSSNHITGGTLIAWVFGPSSVGISWQASTAYATGAVALPTATNGHLYQASTGGTTSGTQPTWPTAGGTVTDGSVVWTDLGTSATAAQLSANATASASGLTLCFGRPSGTVLNMTNFSNHHIHGSGSAPTWAAKTAAGSGGTISVSYATDVASLVTLTTGTGPTSGLVAQMTAAYSLSDCTPAFALTAGNANMATLLSTGGGAYVISNPSVVDIEFAQAPSASTAYQFFLLMIG